VHAYRMRPCEGIRQLNCARRQIYR
jgi:hypothetical protein